ncbi:MAG: ferrochelatase [Bacteroidetes bacterium]|nr:MAG: ferrochelatase [Bacteroidota bacterium]
MQAAKRGIILMNLGSPDSTEVKDVHRYLMQFLMDKRVIDYPYLFRKVLVGGIIVPFRAGKSAEAYRTIWTKDGSPLVAITRDLQALLQPLVSEPVEIAMRYGNPSMQTAYKKLLERMPDMEEVLAIPMYPHYAMSSYETAVEWAREIHRRKKYKFRLAFIKPFYNNPAYIEALSERIRPYVEKDYDHILFSYHGIPERHLRKTDLTGKHCLASATCCENSSIAHQKCYRHQCFETTRLVAKKLGLDPHKMSISFQSRLGREQWLTPYTDFRLKEMPSEGIKNLLVLCPAFVSDCLETLEEIQIRGKESFFESGGEEFAMIPCLNVQPKWVQTLAGWIQDHKAGEKNMILED